MATFEVLTKPQPEAISALTERAHAYLESSGVDMRAAHHVAMILEELLINLGTHGGVPDEPAIVRIAIEPAAVRVEVVDRGPAFDPRSAPDPDVTAAIEDRQVGGLGLFLMRELAADLDYASGGGQNCTRFAVHRSSTDAGLKGT